MVLEAVSMDEKMDSSSDSSGFARAVSIMNRDSVTPVSEQTSEKMGAVGATRSSVAACVLCCFVVCVFFWSRRRRRLDGRMDSFFLNAA